MAGCHSGSLTSTRSHTGVVRMSATDGEIALRLSLSQVAVQAGGPTVSRQALARREGALAGRKLVIWVFAARLLESPPAQMPVPAATSSAPRASP